MISVVICAYSLDRWDELRAAVMSIDLQSVPAAETIVVSDHNAALFDRVRNELPGVTTIENHEARGLAGARNCGVRTARGDIIAFLDDDAIAATDWLSQLNEVYVDPLVNGVGGSIEPLWSSGRPKWFPQEFDWVVGCTYRGMPNKATPVRNLIGANMSFRRGVFELAGGFRSGIGRIGTQPSGCEETELCIRASQLAPGTVFMYQPSARVFHRVPSNRGTWDYYRRRCHAEGRSKVLVATLVGAGDGLASERSYTFGTLPQGVARNLGGALTRNDWSGITRAGAIVAGLVITTVGYVTGHSNRGPLHFRWSVAACSRQPAGPGRDSSGPQALPVATRVLRAITRPIRGNGNDGSGRDSC